MIKALKQFSAITILILTLLIVFSACEKEPGPEDKDPVEEAPIGIRVNNDLNFAIDSLQIKVNSDIAEKSLIFRNIPAKTLSGYLPLDSIQNHFRKQNEYFFINSGTLFAQPGQFITGSCYCDPTYQTAMIKEGKFTIVIYQYDALRKTFDYEIYRD